MALREGIGCLEDQRIDDLADMLKLLSDANRLRILCILSGGERCVCEIEELMGISQPLASHHLGVLKDTGLLKVRKEGTWSHYSIDRDRLRELNETFKEYLGHEKVRDRVGKRKVC